MLSTSLSTQLKTLKEQNVMKKLDVSQPPSSLLFSTTVSRTVDVDLLYTLAMIGYENIKSQLYCPALATQLLSQQMKGINRNHLTLEENQRLSHKLKKLILGLSIFLLSPQCQKIVDYLMRNFSIHIFEGQYLALTHIMYFQSPIYPKLIANINIETQHLSFLKPIIKGHQKINPQFIVRAFEHDRYLLNLITKNLHDFVVESKKQETVKVKGIIEDEAIQASHLTFVSNIYFGLFERDNNKHSKDVIKFCFDLLKVTEDNDAIETILTLLVNILLKVKIQDDFIYSFLQKLIAKSHSVSNNANTNIFLFVIFCWKKHPSLFQTVLIKQIIQSPLKKQFLKPKAANCAVYLCLNKAFFQGVDCIDILKHLSLEVKQDKLIKDNQPLQNGFYDELFSSFIQSDLKQTDNIQGYQQMIKNNFLFEFAEFVNRSYNALDIKILYKIFNKKQFQNNGKISMKGLVQKRIKQEEPKKLNKMQVQQQQQQQSEEQDYKIQPQVQAQPRQVQKIIRSMEIQQNKDRLVELVKQYYSSQTPSITAGQKNLIIEKLDQNIYTDQYILIDISRKDWIQPLAQIKTSSNIQVLTPIINLLVEDHSLLQDIVYKDLLKQVLIRFGIISINNYNNAVNIISEFSDNLSKTINQQNISNVLTLYEIVLFASEQIIKNNGVVKGKLFRLILSLIKLLTHILNSKLYEDRLTKIFKDALFLFEERNLYIFFVGFASLISKTKFDSVSITKWKKILIELYFVQNNKGLTALIQAWNRSISLCSSLVEKNEQFKESTKNVVPKKIIINLFGLIKPKQKIKLAKNILFIIRYIVLSPEFISGFMKQLQSLPEHLRVQMIKQTTDLFSFTLSIKTQDEKLESSLIQLTHDIANLYPLELIVKSITPLLPNENLYSILLEKLQPHPRFRGKILNQILRVTPDKITSVWLRIVSLCLQRGCKIQQDFVALLLQQQTVESLALIGQISKHEVTILVPHLQTIINQLFNLEMDSQYRQAISYVLVSNFKGLLQPYLEQILLTNIQVESQNSEQLLKSLAANFEPTTLLQIVKKIKPASSAQHINLCVLLRQLSILGYGSKITSVFYSVFELITQLFNDDQVDIENLLYIQDIQAQTFQVLCLKLNESQLNKILNNLAIWSEKSDSSNISFSLRKFIVIRIFNKLSETMKDLFLNFNKYLYDSLVVDLSNIHVNQVSTKKQGKRQLSLSSRQLNLISIFINNTLCYFKSIFDNDTQQVFIDTIRFEKLSKTLSYLFTLNLKDNNEDYLSFISTQLTPTTISLCLMVKDDYKLKTLNANILQKLSLSNMLINRGVFLYLGQQIATVGQRNLVLFNDLLPYLAEYRQSRDKNVQSLCRNVISQIQQLSGQKIDSYFHR